MGPIVQSMIFVLVIFEFWIQEVQGVNTGCSGQDIISYQNCMLACAEDIAATGSGSGSAQEKLSQSNCVAKCIPKSKLLLGSNAVSGNVTQESLLVDFTNCQYQCVKIWSPTSFESACGIQRTLYYIVCYLNCIKDPSTRSSNNVTVYEQTTNNEDMMKIKLEYSTCYSDCIKRYISNAYTCDAGTLIDSGLCNSGCVLDAREKHHISKRSNHQNDDNFENMVNYNKCYNLCLSEEGDECVEKELTKLSICMNGCLLEED